MITLKDKLSHLTYQQALRLLGANAKELIIEGGKYDIDIFEQVKLTERMFLLNFNKENVVTITLDDEKHQSLNIFCSSCDTFCVHMGAALSLILEEKMTLGLSAPPPERIPVESLPEKELVERAIEDRKERAKKEKMRLSSDDPDTLWTDYILTSMESGKSYRVALRGWERGESYCSCPDFKKNTLGTCKHLIYALDTVKKRFKKDVRDIPYEPKEIAVYLQYGEEIELRLLKPRYMDKKIEKALSLYFDIAISDVAGLLKKISLLQSVGENIIIYPDAEEYIHMALYQKKVENVVADIRGNLSDHPLRKNLLKVELLPYQLDGIAFAVGAGRAILADDMGLGKTIQGIGAAELFSTVADISKILVVCPASLKSQWCIEIEKFSNRSYQVILGSYEDRAGQYRNDSFFTICNYEQVLRDYLSIETVPWDLIILDEGQRIKNWEAKTTQIMKSLRSRFALVLTGTPIENKVDELFSIIEFVDDRRLGPAFRFFNRHKVVDEKGKLLGYKNLDELREKLLPVMLRRTRQMVMEDLPPRTTEILKIPPTEEQRDLQKAHRMIIQTVLSKKFLNEMDLLRLQRALLMSRLAANSTFLVDKEPPGYSSKLEELDALLGQLLTEEDRKIVLFSEWTTMLDLIEPLLTKRNAEYVRLDGSVPQKKRQALVHAFQKNPSCRLFMTTNAGATGLNLQAANTVINVDLPWNPAILEQRIGRAHRMGQKRPVHVYLLVTEDTIEENLLGTISAKKELSLAVLESDSTVNEVDLFSGMEDLKRRLEILLGNKPDAAEDVTMRQRLETEAEKIKKEKVAVAGGKLMSAAFEFIGEMFSGQEEKSADTAAMQKLHEMFKLKLSDCVEKDENGVAKMVITLPDESFIENMARSLAKIASSGNI